jgi:hypothetical protein
MPKHDKPIVHKDGITGYDTKDVVGKKVAFSFALLAAVTILSALVALGTWKAWESKQSSGAVAILPVAEERALPALPRLQPVPPIDLKALRDYEKSKLDEYAWIDKQAQIVQIPIERAMEIVAEKGLPHGREAHVPTQGPAASAPATGP